MCVRSEVWRAEPTPAPPWSYDYKQISSIGPFLQVLLLSFSDKTEIQVSWAQTFILLFKNEHLWYIIQSSKSSY